MVASEFVNTPLFQVF